MDGLKWFFRVVLRFFGMKERLTDFVWFVARLVVAVGVARLIAWMAFTGRKTVTVTEPEAFAALAVGLAFCFAWREPRG